MSDQTLTRRGEATRSRLLEAAMAELVERDGALEVASVAARADVSVGLLYRYFGSKAGLVAAIVADFYDRSLKEIGEGDDRALDWAARERRRTERSVAFYYREPLAPIVLTLLAREGEVAAVEARFITKLVDDAARSVQRGQRNGEIPEELDARMIGAMLIGAFRVSIAEALTRKRRPTQSALTEQMWHFVVAGARFVPRDERGRDERESEGERAADGRTGA
ncbi:MAG: TetR/AcrR family transcriptional regulator [Solirubrobacterales bacterium]|nr:TetR/AcrR family transcriptional regulator [Solirubrobacterales bacterium]